MVVNVSNTKYRFQNNCHSAATHPASLQIRSMILIINKKTRTVPKILHTAFVQIQSMLIHKKYKQLAFQTHIFHIDVSSTFHQ